MIWCNLTTELVVESYKTCQGGIDNWAIMAKYQDWNFLGSPENLAQSVLVSEDLDSLIIILVSWMTNDSFEKVSFKTASIWAWNSVEDDVPLPWSALGIEEAGGDKLAGEIPTSDRTGADVGNWPWAFANSSHISRLKFSLSSRTRCSSVWSCWLLLINLDGQQSFETK